MPQVFNTPVIVAPPTGTTTDLFEVQKDSVVTWAVNYGGNLVGSNNTAMDTTGMFHNPFIANPASTYTPVWSGTIGNGTLTGRWLAMGRLCYVNVALTWGSTTNGGTGKWTFSMPEVVSQAGGSHMGTGVIDVGTNEYVCWPKVYYTVINGVPKSLMSAKIAIFAGAGQFGDLSAQSYSFSAGDSMQFQSVYEIGG